MLQKIISYKFLITALALSLYFVGTSFASSDEDGNLDIGSAAPRLGSLSVDEDDHEDGDTGASAAAAAAFVMPDIKEEYASPKTDTGFKHLFSRDAPPELAISFLNAVVPEFDTTPIQAIEELSEAVPLLRRKGERQAFMDYHVRTDSGKHIVVEMQVKRHVAFDERALFYAAATYSQQISKESLGNKGWYEKLHPVYAVQIVDYDTNKIRGIKADIDDLLVDRVKAHPMEEGEFRKIYKMTDQISGQTIDHLQMIQLELPRFPDTTAKPLFPPRADFEAIDWWMSIFLHSDKYTKERVESCDYLPAPIQEALKRLDMSQWESDLKESYVADIKDINAYNAIIQAERASERAEIEEAHRKKVIAEKRRMAKQMLEDGSLTKTQIKKYTGIKIRELKRMKAIKKAEELLEAGELTRTQIKELTGIKRRELKRIQAKKLLEAGELTKTQIKEATGIKIRELRKMQAEALL
mgnify:CR=1 FL=1